MENAFKDFDALAALVGNNEGANYYHGFDPSVWFSKLGITAAISELNYRWEQLSGKKIAKALKKELSQKGYYNEAGHIAKVVYGANVSEEQAAKWLNGTEKIPFISLCDVCESAEIYIENILGKLEKRETKKMCVVYLIVDALGAYKVIKRTTTYEDAKEVFDKIPEDDDKYSVCLSEANIDRLGRLYGKEHVIDFK